MPQWWWEDHCFDHGTDNTWWYLWGASQVRLVRELKYGPSNKCDYDPPWRAHFFEGRQMLINHVQLKLGYIGKSHWVIHVVIAYLQTQMHIRALFLPFRGSELEDSGSGNLPHYRLDILVGGLEHVFFHNIWDVILPIDFHIFQRGRSTTNQPT